MQKEIKNRNKNGRPTKSSSEKKSYLVTVKMSTGEYFSLKAKARSAGISRSEFLRRLIQSSIVKEALNKEHMNFIRQLCGMANNVNQLAHIANQSGYSDVFFSSIQLREKIELVIKDIQDVRKNS